MKKKFCLYVLIGILIIIILIGSYFAFRSPWKFREDRPIKIFWLDSYHSTSFTSKYMSGFKNYLEINNVPCEFTKFEMDTLRNTTEQHKLSVALEAKKSIDAYEPDLIFASDDAAQKYVIVPYYFNSKTPVVFTSVEKDPSIYRYDKATNIAGVRSFKHIRESFEFFQKFFPKAMRFVIISEPTDQWDDDLDQVEGVINKMNFELLGRYKPSTFEEFKELILSYQNISDAFILTTLDRFIDKQGTELSSIYVTKWLAENSHIPELTFWPDCVEDGQFGGVVISRYIQGFSAGKIAYEILINGKDPSKFEINYSSEGINMINLARAEKLGLKREFIPSSILINSEVVEKFPWEILECN